MLWQTFTLLKPDGKGYLEVHHLKRLADGGSDTIENAVAFVQTAIENSLW